MIVGVLQEKSAEARVSLLPEAIPSLTKQGIEVLVENNAGAKAFSPNNAYETAGAQIKDRNDILQRANIILSMHAPADSNALTGKILVGMYQPLYHPELAPAWQQQSITAFSLDMLPRTTRAQTMDVLSSQANIAGYKAVLIAANIFPRYFPMFMTAAGSIPPAKVLILGAGVAGLQAIATARRLGAIVEVFDTRAAVKEEVMSLGAKFITVDGAADASKAGGYAVEQTDAYKQQQQQKITEHCAKADIVITTAQIPGKPAPVLINDDMLHNMKQGSVIVDLAAATGGNTTRTVNNETVQVNGTTIIGNSALAASMPYDASKLYGKNILNFLQLLINKEGQLSINMEDELIKGSCISGPFI